MYQSRVHRASECQWMASVNWTSIFPFSHSSFIYNVFFLFVDILCVFCSYILMFLHVHVHTVCMHMQLNLQMILHTEKGHKNQIKIEEDTCIQQLKWFIAHWRPYEGHTHARPSLLHVCDWLKWNLLSAYMVDGWSPHSKLMHIIICMICNCVIIKTFSKGTPWY